MSDSLTSLIPLVADTPEGDERVTTREFDLTQVVKKLTVAIPVVFAAVIGALKAAGVDDATDPPYIVAGLGVTAAALLSLGIVSAADILGRAYVEANPAAPAPNADDTSERDRDDRIAKERQEREDRLEKEGRERDDRLAKERQDREDRLDKERQEREDRLERERRDRAAAATKESA